MIEQPISTFPFNSTIMASTYYSNLNTLQKIQLKKFEFEYPNRKLSANIYSRKCDVSTSTFNPPRIVTFFIASQP